MDSPVEIQQKEEETNETLAAKETLKNKTLQTKTAVKFLLEGKLRNYVCRYCLNVDSCLWELDRLMTIAIKGIAYTVSIRTMVASFHHIKVSDDPNFPIKICETCLEQTLTCYIFSQQCERAERALRNCFDDIDEKLSKLDPIEQNTKKRGRQKLNPNYNTLYASHENVIDYAEPIISLINTTSCRTEEIKTEIKPNECTKCWQEFSTVTLLKNHEKIHPKSMWFHCRFCGKSFAKSNHLKKHINRAHKKPAPKPIEPENFKCKECGYVSGQYLQHLQHVESHKFKTFMNHLVENKLNKLCAICLDNKMGLTDMDKTVCFHGGMPGLNGDVHLKSILRSTIPNMNSYIGNKICKKCYDNALSSYIFINHVNYVRFRLNTCVSSMLDNLGKISSTNSNVLIELSQNFILSGQDDFDEYLLLDENEDFDESKLKVDVLEDEFRVDPETNESDNENKVDIFDDEGEYSCSKVTKTYFNKNKLRNGYKTEKPIQNVFKEFLTFKKETTNSKKRPRRSYLSCPLCSKKFVSTHFVKKHVIKHINKNVPCLVCNLVCKSKFQLYEHVKNTHLHNGETSSTCKICYRIFENENKLLKHAKKHSNKKCIICNKFFKNQKYFEIHLQRHALKFKFDLKKQSQNCSFCEKYCKNDAELSLHVNKVHLQIKPYGCDMCEKLYYCEYNLRKHKILHSLPSKETCKLCNKTLKCRRDLVTHLSKHMKYKPYKCKVCLESFYSEYKIISHMKTIHGGLYYCNICKLVISCKTDFKIHNLNCHSYSQFY